MNASLRLDEASDLLAREAHCLDNRQWDEWLALFDPDAWFWVPAWRTDHELVDDPMREVSLMYHPSRAGLEERVWRVRSGLSEASSVLPRTCHLVGSVRGVQSESGHAVVHSSWNCQRLDLRSAQTHLLFGHYEHHLRNQGQGWRIAGKKVVLMNDRIPTMVDFYCL
ncbi:MAG TPA: aromatic-ring-hydroxylating dioxygenase subunit beta [Burkholderiaceae bacterium]|jgi:3-phenylpropionate/cinnamic acid dioxygenase small subunit|nr:aromatic-ring-hydroxylating dioxygenase subunit beta [Burkholderiaceae bacterium]